MMGTTFLVGMTLKILGICGVGIGATTLLEKFHRYEAKPKKKGDLDDYGKLMREKIKSAS